MQTVNVKDVEWLIIKLTDDTEEISAIQCERGQLKEISNITENSMHAKIEKNEKLLQFKCKQRRFKITTEQHKVNITMMPT